MPMPDISIPRALKMEVQLQDLELLQELGSGNGGTVHKVMHKTTNTIMALKVINTILISGYPGRSKKQCTQTNST
jgi:hypothetical protein